jgi:hypothetical protein
MMDRIRNWLPLGAAVGPRVRDALEGAVDDWSGRWFAGARPSLDTVEPRAAGATPAPGGWLLYGDAVAVSADGPGTIRVAGLALGTDVDGLILSEADRDILGQLATRIFADLASALGSALGMHEIGDAPPDACDDPFKGDAGIFLRILDVRGRAFALAALPLGTVVPFLRGGIPARPTPPLARIDGALGHTRTRLDIRLGETRLSLGELAGLASGDVLILDRTIEAGAEIAIAVGRRPGFASAALEPDDGGTRLILASEKRDI